MKRQSETTNEGEKTAGGELGSGIDGVGVRGAAVGRRVGVGWAVALGRFVSNGTGTGISGRFMMLIVTNTSSAMIMRLKRSMVHVVEEMDRRLWPLDLFIGRVGLLCCGDEAG